MALPPPLDSGGEGKQKGWVHRARAGREGRRGGGAQSLHRSILGTKRATGHTPPPATPTPAPAPASPCPCHPAGTSQQEQLARDVY